MKLILVAQYPNMFYLRITLLLSLKIDNKKEEKHKRTLNKVKDVG